MIQPLDQHLLHILPNKPDSYDLSGNKPEWLKFRAKGLGGTDMSVVMGRNKYRSLRDVYDAKVNPKPQEFEDNERMYWGRELEINVAREYAKRTNQTVYSIGWLQSKTDDWMVGSPDFVTETCVVECKTAGRTFGWGPDGSDQVPEMYYIQAAHYCNLTGFRRADIPVLFGGQEFRIYHLFPSEQFLEELRVEGAAFWNDYVLPKNPPQLTHEEEGERLDNLSDLLDETIEASAEDEHHIVNLIEARKEQKHWTEQRKELETMLKKRIGNNDGMRSKCAYITYRRPKSSTSVAWKSIYQDVLNEHDSEGKMLSPLLKKHTSDKQGVRRFVLKTTGGE